MLELLLFHMHFVLIMLLIGGGCWGWRHASSPAERLFSGLAVALGAMIAVAVCFYYLAIRREEKR
jgi:protein-S-isoprenylcysteine O-methyltransferase Ste14